MPLSSFKSSFVKQVCRSTTFFFSFCFIFALYADGFPKAKKKLVLIINKSEATTANLMAIKKLEEENTGSNWVDIRLIDMTEFKFDFKDPKFGTVEFELEQRLGDVLPNEYGSACVYYLVDGGVASMRHVSSLSSVEFRPSGGEIELFGYAKTDLVFKEIIDRIGKKVPTSIVVGSSFGQFVAKELASTYSLPSIASPGTEILSFSGENQDSIGNDFFYAIAGARLMGQFLELSLIHI